MAGAMLALLVVYGAWQLSGVRVGPRPLIGDAFFYPVGIAAAGASAAAAWRCRKAPRLRAAWLLLALASVTYLGGDVAQTLYELAGRRPYPSIADGLYLSFYPLVLWGLLLFPTGRRTRRDRVRLGLDMAVVAVGGFMVVVYLVLGPTIVQASPDPLQTAFSVAYPVGDMVLLVGVASVLLRRAAPSSVLALQLMASSLMFFVAADLVYGYITLHSSYQGGDPVDSLWMIAIAVFAIAASAQRPPGAGEDGLAPQPARSASWVPYVAIVAASVVLLVDERGDPFFPNLSLAFAVVVLAMLVSARQLVAQRDLVHAQGQLAYQALHDALTGLPNRALVLDRAEQMLSRARRDPTAVAALYIDIDGFKQINDTLGHATGDQVLRVVAGRLSEVIRGSDTVGRLGGDEFIVLVDGYALDAGPEMIAERICEVIAQPIELERAERRSLSVTVSIGIAAGLRPGADDLLRDADLALYEAKAAGKNRWRAFESRMHSALQDRIALELDLREALDAGDQLFLLYQPIVDLRTETITGVEALLRWRHPERGVLGPDAFITLAEETGLIVPIGRWVLNAACRQAAAWRAARRPLDVAVNLSARQLDSERLIDDVTAALERTGCDPGALVLEITETTLMSDCGAAAERLRQLKHLGVHIAIDDFGTGYSSLAYLRQLPVDVLKIDRAFIAGLAQSRASRTLVQTLVQLGRALGMQTVGEGIEDEAQLRELQHQACDRGQGFLFARPLTAEAIDDLLGLGATRGDIGDARAARTPAF
ncbi:MAG TPA: EAL domain-containing protein [Solirubrobacteraceae bacterium]|nr:EAL domain-containing protein [Solirubrobacteraceae bacterium]